MRDDMLQEVIEAWVVDRCLSRRKLAFLETVHDQTWEGITSCSPDVAPGDLCDALELPGGSYWCELVAELLDFVKPLDRPLSRLAELQQAIVDLELRPA